MLENLSFCMGDPRLSDEHLPVSFSNYIFIGCTFKLICKLKEMNIIPISA